MNYLCNTRTLGRTLYYFLLVLVLTSWPDLNLIPDLSVIPHGLLMSHINFQ